MMVVSVLTTVVLPYPQWWKSLSLISMIKSDVEFVARTESPLDAGCQSSYSAFLCAVVRLLFSVRTCVNGRRCQMEQVQVCGNDA